MTEAIKKYQESIEGLNPLEDSIYSFDPTRWRQLDGIETVMDSEFTNLEISRQRVIDAYSKYYNRNVDFLNPFILTMIWGFANSGYGFYRTNNYIRSKDNRDLIKEGLDAVKSQDIQLGFKKLMKIKGLNISYVSKVLYFTSRALGHKKYPLIFDIRVARGIVALHLDREVTSFLNVTPKNSWKEYEAYNQQMHQWANELNVPAENVEYFIFKGEFK